MITSAFDATPIPYDGKEEIPSDGGIELVMELDDRLTDGLMRMSDWLDSAYKAHKYYKSEQYRENVSRKDRNRIRLIANFIRRDVDLIVSELLDGEPVVNPVGRGSKNYELGRQLLQVLQWTRDEEENWEADLERAITDCVHIGEGALFEGWDQDADNGRGRPCTFRIDTRFLVWDESSTDIQHDDAEWVVWFNWERLKNIEARYPDLKGKIQPESIDYYMVARQHERKPTMGSLVRPCRPDDRVWVKRQWERKVVYEPHYIDKGTGEPALVPIDGEVVPVDPIIYDQLDESTQDQIVETRRRTYELWETVAIGSHVVEHHISPFCTSNKVKGHGRFPISFFKYEILADEPRARGEIQFLTDTQDIRNEVVTQVLEQLFLSNVGFWHLYRGSVTPEEREKFNRIFYEPHQAIETLPGSPPPTHQGMDSRGLQAASAVLPLVKGLADDTSGIHAVDRGELPGHIESGRAIRALQAKASRLNIKIKRHIEAGLRRSTVMRLHNIMQFMRGPRVLEVTEPATNHGKMLVIAHSMVEAVAYYELKPGEGEGGKPSWVMPDGLPVDILLLNDQVVEDVLFERVKLTLDTGREANRLERMEQAEMVLKSVGPAAIPWAARELEWQNADELIAAVEKRDAAMQQMKMMEEHEKKTGQSAQDAMQQMEMMAEFEKQTGMSAADAIKMVMQAMQGNPQAAEPAVAA